MYLKLATQFFVVSIACSVFQKFGAAKPSSKDFKPENEKFSYCCRWNDDYTRCLKNCYEPSMVEEKPFLSDGNDKRKLASESKPEEDGWWCCGWDSLSMGCCIDYKMKQFQNMLSGNRKDWTNEFEEPQPQRNRRDIATGLNSEQEEREIGEIKSQPSVDHKCFYVCNNDATNCQWVC